MITSEQIKKQQCPHGIAPLSVYKDIRLQLRFFRTIVINFLNGSHNIFWINFIAKVLSYVIK